MTSLLRFRETFSGYEDCYTIIGGTACQVAIGNLGGSFRATHDLDIVVIVDASQFERFGEAFWAFVREGGYIPSRGSKGKTCFYRFRNPTKEGYPREIELFSRSMLDEPADVGRRIVPIPLSESISSLSAILLDDAYYELLLRGRKAIDGVSVLGVEWLIPFKMKARVDLLERSISSGGVDSRDLKKHQKDVFRLWEYADTEMRIDVPDGVKADILAFFEAVDITPEQLRAMGVGEEASVIENELRLMYGLEEKPL